MKASAGGLGAWPAPSSAALSRRNSSCAYIFLHEKFVYSTVYSTDTTGLSRSRVSRGACGLRAGCTATRV